MFLCRENHVLKGATIKGKNMSIFVPLKDPTVILFGFWEHPFHSHLGIYIVKIEKTRTKIHEIGKIKAILGLGMTPI